jgi:hypothetical protein
MCITAGCEKRNMKDPAFYVPLPKVKTIKLSNKKLLEKYPTVLYVKRKLSNILNEDMFIKSTYEQI